LGKCIQMSGRILADTFCVVVCPLFCVGQCGCSFESIYPGRLDPRGGSDIDISVVCFFYIVIGFPIYIGFRKSETGCGFCKCENQKVEDNIFEKSVKTFKKV